MSFLNRQIKNSSKNETSSYKEETNLSENDNDSIINGKLKKKKERVG